MKAREKIIKKLEKMEEDLRGEESVEPDFFVGATHAIGEIKYLLNYIGIKLVKKNILIEYGDLLNKNRIPKTNEQVEKGIISIYIRFLTEC